MDWTTILVVWAFGPAITVLLLSAVKADLRRQAGKRQFVPERWRAGEPSASPRERLAEVKTWRILRRVKA